MLAKNHIILGTSYIHTYTSRLRTEFKVHELIHSYLLLPINVHTLLLSSVTSLCSMYRSRVRRMVLERRMSTPCALQETENMDGVENRNIPKGGIPLKKSSRIVVTPLTLPCYCAAHHTE